MSKYILFGKGKGGMGASVCLTFTARELARRGYKVLMVDADCQGSLATAFGRPITGDLKRLFDGEFEAMTDVASSVGENMWLVSSDATTSVLATVMEADNIGAMMRRMMAESQAKQLGVDPGPEAPMPYPDTVLRSKIEELVSSFEAEGTFFDLVFIDTGADGLLQRMGLTAADGVVFPVGCRAMDLATVPAFLNLYKSYAEATPICIMPTFYNLRPGSSSKDIHTILANHYSKIMSPVIPESEYIKQATQAGVALWDIPKNRASGIVDAFSAAADWMVNFFGLSQLDNEVHVMPLVEFNYDKPTAQRISLS